MSTPITVDDVFTQDDHPKYTKSVDSHQASLLSKLKNIISISEILRVFGAFAVIASMSLFLLNGWTEGNDIQRYLKLLMQTGLLTVAGFVMSYALKENKGARLFFALALISVVANFTILGALTYSMVQLDGGLIDYPSMVTWVAVSAGSFWPVFVGAVVVLMLLARFSFSIFARTIAGPLSAHFLAMNALLLIPVRSSVLVSVIAIAALWVSAVVVKKLAASEKIVITNESKFAFGLLFAPALLIIARAISLYHVDEVIMVLLSGLAYVFLRYVKAKSNQSSLPGLLVIILQYAAGMVLAMSVVELMPQLGDSIQALLFSFVASALMLDQMFTSSSAKIKQAILSFTTIVIVTMSMVFTLAEESIVIALLNVLVCTGLLYIAQRTSNAKQHNWFAKLTAFIGVLVCTGALIFQIVELFNLGNWTLIGLLGVSLIVMGSLYERFGLPIASVFISKQ